MTRDLRRSRLAAALLAMSMGCAGSAPSRKAPAAVDYAGSEPSAGSSPRWDARLVGTGLTGPDVPHWPMFRHDSARSGRNGVARTTPPVLKWRYATHGEVWSSAAIGLDGAVYVGSLDGRLYGNELWSFKTEAGIEASPAIGPSGEVVVGSRDGSVYGFR